MTEEKRSTAKYILTEFYPKDVSEIVKITHLSTTRIKQLLAGEGAAPQKKTINYLIEKRFVPEFQIVTEFASLAINSEKDISKALNAIFKDHKEQGGIYAFYDGLANLVYVGKALYNLQKECYQQLKASVNIKFPKGMKMAPSKRYDVVKYLSAYNVGYSELRDYPKHVESLILRISKPILNTQIGTLQSVVAQPKDVE